MNKSMTATLKYALVSDKKMSLITKLVAGKKAAKALEMLDIIPKKPAKILIKVIKSAVSNAQNAWNTEELYIEEIKVGRAPKLKRIRFTSRSRISHYVKFRSFVKVILNSK